VQHRSLDESLATTHGSSRVFVIIARYCAEACESLFLTLVATLTVHPVWQGDVLNFQNARRTSGLSFQLLTSFAEAFLSFAYWRITLGAAEWAMDMRARAVKMRLWAEGLGKGGLTAAQAEMAGLAIAR